MLLGNWLFGPCSLRSMLETQSDREFKLWYIRHEIRKKGSKIVSLGAPFSL
jgi:hypothetical protein